MKLILVLVDALKSLYLNDENMPFLAKLSREGRYIKQIIPSSGFCERSEILTGLDSFDTANFTAIGFCPEGSDYSQEKISLFMADKLSSISLKGTRYFFYKYCSLRHKIMKPYLIPYKSLKYFSLTEDGGNKYTDYLDLFEKISDAGLTYSIEYFTSLANTQQKRHISVQEFVKDKIDERIDFVPIYMGMIDTMGHKHGNDIDSIKPYLQDVDRALNNIYQMSVRGGYAFAVLGDHGMVPVSERLNLIGSLEKLKIRLHKDYELFLDSTMARFWSHNKSVFSEIRNYLEYNLKNKGVIIDKDNYMQHHIPMDVMSREGKPIYGDILWCAHPGILIEPDYFNPVNKNIKGMHGYLETDMTHGTGLYVSSYSGCIHESYELKYLKEICNEICLILGIDTPNSICWERKMK